MHLGPLAIQTEHAFLAFAMLIAMGVGHVVGRAQRIGIAEVLIDMLLVAMLAARIAFVIAWFDKYQMHPWSMLDIRDGGFTPWAGWVATFLYACWRFWRSPVLRRPLAWGLVSGILMWGALTTGLASTTKPETPIPALPLKTLDGKATTLASLAQGKPSVINLWATWCPPCRREMPVLAQAQAFETDITFVFVNQGEDQDKVREYLRKSSLQLTNMLLDTGNSAARSLGSDALPTTFFFDAQGTLVATHTGALSEASLAAKLEQIRK